MKEGKTDGFKSLIVEIMTAGRKIRDAEIQKYGISYSLNYHTENFTISTWANDTTYWVSYYIFVGHDRKLKYIFKIKIDDADLEQELSLLEFRDEELAKHVKAFCGFYDRQYGINAKPIRVTGIVNGKHLD